MWGETDVQRALPLLRRYARSLARDRAAADDLVQDVLLRAYEKSGTFQPGRSLKVWLLAILRNAFISGIRRREAEAARDEDFAYQTADAIASSDPEQAVYLAQIAARFARLPEAQRSVLHLVAVEGFSYQEAADALEVPIGTIMSRISRARAALREADVALHPLRIVGGKDAS